MTPDSARGRPSTAGHGFSRPRVEGDREAEILDAALEILAELWVRPADHGCRRHGGEGSKATLYRRWDTKAELVVDALSRAKGAPQVASGGHRLAARRPDGHGMQPRRHQRRARRSPSCRASSPRSSTTRSSPTRSTSASWRPSSESREIYQRAQRRGEIASDVDLEILTPTLAAIILHRAFVLRQPVDDPTILRIIDEIVIPAATHLAAVGTPHPTSPR